MLETREAFDSVAADYDGERGNNAMIQDMRSEMWRWLDATFGNNAHLIDLGCGTGLDAVRMARQGHRITATDWSPKMVARTRERVQQEGLTACVDTRAVGSHQLQHMPESAAYDGAYSNLGPLNCVPDLAGLSRECARLLKPGGKLVFTVISRFCPWEILHYAWQGSWARVKVRFSRGAVPVGMNDHTIWTRYYTPRQFYQAFQTEFVLDHIRGLCVFAPPPYLTWVRERYPHCHAALWRIDRRIAGWPVLRAAGDHFLIVMRKR